MLSGSLTPTGEHRGCHGPCHVDSRGVHTTAIGGRKRTPQCDSRSGLLAFHRDCLRDGETSEDGDVFCFL